MKKLPSRAAIAAAALVPVFAGAFMLQQQQSVAGARLLDQVLQLTSTRYVDTVSTSMLYEKAARGLVRELNDPYSVLFTPKEFAAFNQQTGGEYAGLGMEILEQLGYVTVQRVFPNTPAAAGGVLEGDRIAQIDTFNTRGWSNQQVSEKLKGKPGSKVTVKFLRPGATEPITSTFTRAVVHIPAVQYSMLLDGNIGYIVLQQFNGTATEDLDNAIEQVTKAGAKKLIVDLRGNPGGILDQAISTSNLFLKQGQQVASVRTRSGEAQAYSAQAPPRHPDIPTVLLVDGRSASASEIVAGALQDHDRALIIGTTSFGKGLVQSLFQLDGGYALKMTTAKWFTPSGRSIQKDRKLLPDGEFVEVMPDSLETDSVKRARPKFKSDAGRTVYGGGGVTPDIIVRPDTLTTAESKLIASLIPKRDVLNAQLRDYAGELKGKITRDFTVTPKMRAEFVKRLRDKGVPVDSALLAQGGSYLDYVIGSNVATFVFGDSTAKRKYVNEDNQLVKAIQVLKQAPTQQALFPIAQREMAQSH